jgi:hypothetical protein
MSSGSTIDLYPTPIAHDLTAHALGELAPVPCRPIVPGDTWDLAFRVVDVDGAAVDLTGAKVVLSVRRNAPGAANLFDRDTATDLAGEVPGTKQIALSATPTDGKFTVRFRAGDEAVLITALGLNVFDVRVKFASGAVETRAQGAFEVVATPTPNGQIP